MPILNDVKSVVSIQDGDTGFDIQILLHINHAVSTLIQLGDSTFTGVWVDETTEWPTYSDDETYRLVRSYIPAKTSILFDVQANAVVNESVKNAVYELEHRITLHLAETGVNELHNYVDDINTHAQLIGVNTQTLLSLQSDVSQLQTSVDGLQLSGDVVSLSNRIAALETDYTTLNNNQSTLLTGLTNLSSSVTTLETNYTSLSGNVTTLDTNLTSLQTSYTSMNTDVTNLLTGQTDLTNRVSTLESTPSSTQDTIFTGGSKSVTTTVQSQNGSQTHLVANSGSNLIFSADYTMIKSAADEASLSYHTQDDQTGQPLGLARVYVGRNDIEFRNSNDGHNYIFTGSDLATALATISSLGTIPPTLAENDQVVDGILRSVHARNAGGWSINNYGANTNETDWTIRNQFQLDSDGIRMGIDLGSSGVKTFDGRGLSMLLSSVPTIWDNLTSFGFKYAGAYNGTGDANWIPRWGAVTELVENVWIGDKTVSGNLTVTGNLSSTGPIIANSSLTANANAYFARNNWYKSTTVTDPTYTFDINIDNMILADTDSNDITVTLWNPASWIGINQHPYFTLRNTGSGELTVDTGDDARLIRRHNQTASRTITLQQDEVVLLTFDNTGGYSVLSDNSSQNVLDQKPLIITNDSHADPGGSYRMFMDENNNLIINRFIGESGRTRPAITITPQNGITLQNTVTSDRSITASQFLATDIVTTTGTISEMNIGKLMSPVLSRNITLTPSATVNIDLSTGPNFNLTVDENTALTLSNVNTTVDSVVFTLDLSQDNVGAHTVAWPAEFNWGDVGEPTLSSDANKIHKIQFEAVNNTVRAVYVGSW